MSENLKRTPLYHIHKKLGARLVEFGGWEMPVQYSGIIDEHLTVRSNAGLFDLSHMGEIEIRGPGALPLIQKLITNDAARKLVDGQVLYTPMCNAHGGIVDDLLVYRFTQDRYTLVVNASNIEKDFEWICAHNDTDAKVENRSDETVLIALQGRNSPEILQELADVDLASIKYYWFTKGEIAGIPTIISRTGYTGEVGFELYVDANRGEDLWNAIYEAAITIGGKPVGLGARDTLRLEARLCLYGNDIDETTTPLEAGLRWTVSFDKGDFIGRDALIKQRNEGIKRRLSGFQMLDRSIARSHYAAYRDDRFLGEVTSGAPSPSLKCNIGLAYLPIEQSKINAKIEIEIRGKRHPAKIVRTPFYKPS
ncbi:glycine cleavage system aminomethyltransferase GcvT [Candidatus Poribacteria bacterium]|nr:glycine cleavage system aminomethyltransferase GcvT [Candidatus Poribacteria bacterium]